jgi:multisubunit Na+/H+ antiporter MnhB subunit
MIKVWRTMAMALTSIVLNPVSHAVVQVPTTEASAELAVSAGAKASDDCTRPKSPGPAKPPTTRPDRPQQPGQSNVNLCAPVINIGSPASAAPSVVTVPAPVVPPAGPASEPANKKDAKDAAAEALRKAAEEKNADTEFTFKVKDLVEAGFKSKDRTLVYVCVGTFMVLLCLFAGTYLFKKFAVRDPKPTVSPMSVAVWLGLGAIVVLLCWFFWPGSLDQRHTIAEVEIATRRRIVEATEARSTAAVKAAVDAQMASLRAELLLQNAQLLAQRPNSDRASESGAGAPSATVMLVGVWAMVAGAALVVLALAAAYVASVRREREPRSIEEMRPGSPMPKKSSSAVRRDSRLLAAIFEAQDAAVSFIGEIRRRQESDPQRDESTNEIQSAPLLAALGALQWNLEVKDDLRYSPTPAAAESDLFINGTADEMKSIEEEVHNLTEILSHRDDLSLVWRRQARDQIWALRRRLLTMSKTSAR